VRKAIRPSPIRLDQSAAIVRRMLAVIVASASRLARISGIVLAAIAIEASGCGYHFAAEGSGLPPQAKTIYVQKFGNKTRQTGINDEFMRYVDDEIANHSRLQLVDSASSADLVLTGDVIYADSLPIAFNSADEPTIYAQTIGIDASLFDARGHKIIWASRGLSNSQNTPVVSEAAVTTSPYFVQQNLRSQNIATMQDLQVAQTQRKGKE